MLPVFLDTLPIGVICCRPFVEVVFCWIDQWVDGWMDGWMDVSTFCLQMASLWAKLGWNRWSIKALKHRWWPRNVAQQHWSTMDMLKDARCLCVHFWEGILSQFKSMSIWYYQYSICLHISNIYIWTLRVRWGWLKYKAFKRCLNIWEVSVADAVGWFAHKQQCLKSWFDPTT